MKINPIIFLGVGIILAGFGFGYVDARRPVGCSIRYDQAINGRIAAYRVCHGRLSGLETEPAFVRYVD